MDTQLLESVLETLPCNVSILARPQRIEEARDLTPEALDQTLRLLAQFFPFVVVDMPRTCSPINRTALDGAGRILLVTQLSVPHLRNASRLNEHLLSAGFAPEQVQIVLNRCNASFENISVQDVEKHFNRRIYASIPNDYRHVTNSRDLGHPIVTDAPKSPARRAIHELAQRLIAEAGGQPTAEPANSGWLEKLFAGSPRKPTRA
jgi:pilus assembly protein CpaE